MAPKDTYRGRSRWKAALKLLAVAALLLAALAVAAFFYLQRYIVYYDDGIKLMLPFLHQDDAQPTESATPAMELVIDTPAPSETASAPEASSSSPAGSADKPLESLTAVFVPAATLEDAGWTEACLDEMDAAGAAGLVLDMKPESGKLPYASALAAAQSAGASSGEERSEALRAAIEELKQKDVYLVARISCCIDNLAATSGSGMALMASETQGWTDFGANRWLDPSSEAARAYLCGVAAELADMGFDEILLDNLRLPARDEGKTDKIRYTTGGRDGAEQALRDLVGVMRTTLGDRGTVLSVMAEERFFSGGSSDAEALRSLLDSCDRVCARCGDAEAALACERAFRIADAAADTGTRFVRVTADAGAEEAAGSFILKQD